MIELELSVPNFRDCVLKDDLEGLLGHQRMYSQSARWQFLGLRKPPYCDQEISLIFLFLKVKTLLTEGRLGDTFDSFHDTSIRFSKQHN